MNYATLPHFRVGSLASFRLNATIATAVTYECASRRKMCITPREAFHNSLPKPGGDPRSAGRLWRRFAGSFPQPEATGSRDRPSPVLSRFTRQKRPQHAVRYASIGGPVLFRLFRELDRGTRFGVERGVFKGMTRGANGTDHRVSDVLQLTSPYPETGSPRFQPSVRFRRMNLEGLWLRGSGPRHPGDHCHWPAGSHLPAPDHSRRYRGGLNGGPTGVYLLKQRPGEMFQPLHRALGAGHAVGHLAIL
jgi:hypothetical protein